MGLEADLRRRGVLLYSAGTVLVMGGAWQDGGTTMPASNLPAIRACRQAWNKGRIVGQKRPLMPKHVWAIRVRLEIAGQTRDLHSSISQSTANCAAATW